MRFGSLAALVLVLGTQSVPASAGSLAPQQIEAALPCLSGLQPDFSAKGSAPGDRLCRALAAAVLGIPFMSEIAAAALPENARPPAPALQRVVQRVVTVLMQPGPRDFASLDATDTAWAQQMRLAVSNYSRIFHTGASLDQLPLPPAPAMPWDAPAT